MVELDAVLGERPADPLDQELDALRGELGGAALRGARDLLGELAHVVALVAVLRRLLAARPGQDRRAEPVDLPAGVVEVVLALDLVADEAQDPPQRVAVGRVAAARGGQRPGRVGGDELDLDPLARLGLAAAVAVAGRQHLGGGRACTRRRPGRGSGSRGRRPRRGRAASPSRSVSFCAEPLRDLARRRLQRRGQQHRRVGREVAEAGLARPLERRARLRGAAPLRRSAAGGLDGFAEVFDGVHEVNDGRARRPGSCGRGRAARAAPRGRAGAAASSGPSESRWSASSSAVPNAPPSTKQTSRPAWRRSSSQRANASES